MSPSDAETDGGTPEPSRPTDVFQTESVEDESFTERVGRTFDIYVYAPLAVGLEDWRTRAGGLILIYFVLQGFVGPFFIDEPVTFNHAPSLPPFHDGWINPATLDLFGMNLPWFRLVAPLGTQDTGQSLYALIVYGTLPMFKMIFAGAVFSIVLAVLIGTVSGFKGGLIDRALMIVTDVVLTIPALALVLVIASIYAPESPYVVGLILGIDNWPGLARTIRSQVLSIREESFVEAHRTMGLPTAHILHRDFISQLMPYISINFANSARRIVFESVALYFLGILPFTTQNWGVVMNTAYQRTNLTNVSELYWIFIPMISITVFTLGIILFAQGLDRVFNVRLQARHAKTVGGDDSREGPQDDQGTTNTPID